MRWAPGGIVKAGQVVPDDFAATLRAMYADGDPRLSPLLHLAVRNGWTLTALGEVLGMTREGVRQRVLRVGSYQSTDLPSFPLPPRHPTPMPRPQRTLLVPSDIAEKLREMQQVVRTVNGATPADDSRRKVCEEFSAIIAALVDKGVPVYQIAKVLGVTHYAIRSRLARFGYRNPVPSVMGTPDATYKGRPAQHWRTGICQREHHMSGPNLGIKRNGSRYCKACDRDSHRKRYAERRAARPTSSEAA